MSWSETNPNLRFERPPRSLSHRAIAVGVGLAIFTLLWILLPSSTLYWLLLFFLGVLVWVASYGWRQALSTLIVLLRRLEQL